MCFCGKFLSFSFIFVPDLFVSHRRHLDLIICYLCIQSEDCITVSCETFFLANSLNNWFRHQCLAHARLQIARILTALYPSASSGPFVANTQPSGLRSDVLLDTAASPFSLSLCHRACFTALLAVWLRALTQKVGLRTQRTATWPTLWSDSLHASSTKCAQRAE